MDLSKNISTSENNISGINNDQRYWRVRNNLQKIMEFAGYQMQNEQLFDEIDQNSGVIFAPTHSSWLDIIALAAANPVKPMRFLGKQELWKVPYIGKLAQDAGAYAVDRSDGSSRMSAVDKSIELLNKNEWLVMYPEGTRNKSKDRRSLGKIKTGVARTALMATGSTIIVPVGIGYGKSILGRRSSLHKASIVFGEPYEIKQGDTNGENVRLLTDDLEVKLRLLKNKAVDLAES